MKGVRAIIFVQIQMNKRFFFLLKIGNAQGLSFHKTQTKTQLNLKVHFQTYSLIVKYNRKLKHDENEDILHWFN